MTNAAGGRSSSPLVSHSIYNGKGWRRDARGTDLLFEFQISSDWMPTSTDVWLFDVLCLLVKASPSWFYPLFVLVWWTIPFGLLRFSSRFVLFLFLRSNILPDSAISRRNWSLRLNLCSLTLFRPSNLMCRFPVYYSINDFKKLDRGVSIWFRLGNSTRATQPLHCTKAPPHCSWT